MSYPIQCRIFNPVENAPDTVMILPAGTHKIRTSLNKKPVELWVKIDPDTVSTCEKSRQRYEAERNGTQMNLDFDHQNREAAAWVQSFHWQETPRPGVFASVLWTEAGRRAVSGRNYKSLSPCFFPTIEPQDTSPERPARVAALDGNCAALVNRPAFREIFPLWNKEAQPIRIGGLLNLPNYSGTPLRIMAKESGMLTCRSRFGENIYVTVARVYEVISESTD